MSHRVQENHQGTGLKDVFGILVKTLPERLLSLTFQLGDSPEDQIIHALSLIILKKEERALDKLQRLKDNYLATHLAEKWQMSGGKLDDFAVHCGHCPELAGESFALLARVFKVLSEQELCHPFLRNLAYSRALSSDNQRASSCEKLEYDHLTEEANVVCGPHFAEWACSSSDLKSGPRHDPLSSLDERINTLKVTPSQDVSESDHSLPSSLLVPSSMPSYPTHLEISIPPTDLFEDVEVTPETSVKSEPALLSKCETKDALPSSQPPLSDSAQHSKMDETSPAEGSQSDSLLADDKTPNQTPKPTVALPSATRIVPPMMSATNDMHDSEDAEEEEEAIFYAFVILHAPEDEDMAESIREKIQAVIGSDGATFSGDFALPGKSTLRCLADAINNSAFTFLLLTCNFNTRMLDLETDSALINSINKTHKYNTVIPLMPLENCMPKKDIPMVVQTIITLRENQISERKLKHVFSPVKIKNQRKMWNVEQKEKRERERQVRLKQQIKECAAELEEETLRLLLQRKQDVSDGRIQCQQQPTNINIVNANCVLIGNNSTLTVDLGGDADKVDSEEEQ